MIKATNLPERSYNMTICVTRSLIRCVEIAVVCALLAFPAIAQTTAPTDHGSPSRVVMRAFPADASSKSGRVALYASVGEELIEYSVDIAAAKVVRQGSLMPRPMCRKDGFTLPGDIYI